MKDNNKFIPFTFISLGVINILSLVVVNSFILRIFSSDGILSSSTVENIKSTQISLIFLGALLVIIGFCLSNWVLFIKNKIHDNLISFLISIIFIAWSFTSIEIMMRISPIPNTEDIHKYSIKYDQSIFSLYQFSRNNQVIPYLDDPQKTPFKIINGYRSELFNPIKPKDEIRIFILGGSFVFDYNAEYMRDWPTRVEKLLNESGDGKFRVINAGVPGLRSSDAVGRLLSEIHMFSPDYVILCNTWNDIKYFRFINPEESLLKNYKGISSNTFKSLTPFVKLNPFIKLLENSQLFLRLKSLVYLTKNHSEDVSKNTIGREGYRYPNLVNDYSDYGPKQFKLNVNTFVDICNNLGIKPVLFTQPRLISEKNNTEDKNKIVYSYSGLEHATLNSAFLQCDKILFDISKNKKTEFFDLSNKMSGNSDYFSDHVHLTDLGNNKITELIASYLNTLINNHSTKF